MTSLRPAACSAASFVAWLVALAGTDGAGAAPRIDLTFPPPEDLRAPDRTMAGAAGPGALLVYAPDGRTLVTAAPAGQGTRLRVWHARPADPAAGTLARELEALPGRPSAIGFRLPGPPGASGGRTAVGGPVAAPGLAAGASSPALVVLTGERTFTVLDPGGGGRLSRIRLATPLRAAVVRPGPGAGVAGLRATRVELVDERGGAVLRSFAPAPGAAAVRRLAFTPDGETLPGATARGEILRWRSDDGVLIDRRPTGGQVRALAASASHGAAALADGRLLVWPLAGDQAGGTTGPPGADHGAARAGTLQPAPRPIGPPGRSAEAASRSVSLALPGGRGRRVTALALGGRGEQIAAAGAGSVIVWDVATGQRLCEQVGHSGAVTDLAFSGNGQKMASAGADGTARTWTVPLPPLPPALGAAIAAAVPAVAARVRPERPRKLLVFWRAEAILHKAGVPAANAAIAALGRQTGAFAAHFSRDYQVFDPAVLAGYDALVFNSTAHLDPLEGPRGRALLDWVARGGGVVGIHAAIDMWRRWPEGAEVVGATFAGHPWGPTGSWAVKLDEPGHPLLRAFADAGPGFKLQDEFYELGDPYRRADRRVLLSLDLRDAATAGVTPLHRADRDFAVAWIKRQGTGRVFYAMFGHRAEPFTDRRVLQFYLDGIQYALGDLAADATPKPGASPPPGSGAP